MTEVSLNFSYVRTVPGIIRMVEVLLDFLACFIAGIYCGYGYGCRTVALGYGGISWCLFVYSTGFLAFGAFFLVHVLNLDRLMGRLLPLVELILCAVYAFFHFTAFCTMAAYAHDFAYLTLYSWEGQAVVACLFSLIVTGTLAVDAFLAVRNRDSHTPNVLPQ